MAGTHLPIMVVLATVLLSYFAPLSSEVLETEGSPVESLHLPADAYNLIEKLKSRREIRASGDAPILKRSKRIPSRPFDPPPYFPNDPLPGSPQYYPPGTGADLGLEGGGVATPRFSSRPFDPPPYFPNDPLPGSPQYYPPGTGADLVLEGGGVATPRFGARPNPPIWHPKPSILDGPVNTRPTGHQTIDLVARPRKACVKNSG